jgi:hypothetical protein
MTEREKIKQELPKFTEFMNQPLQMDKRANTTFSDELVIRKAKIYKVLGPKDDRLQVQVLPELQSIDEAEMDELPKYPPFYDGQVITGLSYKDDGADKAEFVWVVCTPDLQVGYILGKANIFGDTVAKYKHSYSWKDIKSFLRDRRALPEDFDYKHLVVTNWLATENGGLIECYNHQNGDWCVINTSGSVIVLQQKQLYMRVGTPNDKSRAAFSAITLTADKIHCKTPNFEIDADDVILAHNGLQAFGTISSGVLIGKNGVSGNSVRNVHI